jgi:hypothetical protein
VGFYLFIMRHSSVIRAGLKDSRKGQVFQEVSDEVAVFADEMAKKGSGAGTVVFGVGF